MKKMNKEIFNFITEKTEQIKSKSAHNFQKYFFAIIIGSILYLLGRFTRFMIEIFFVS